mmetsp:Transcript_11502/g.16872  ORF Transcript_11502/g.16872 Transcript_11502/m.16872 type:complete len:128 (+) Transcript_11502:37-420(+)
METPACEPYVNERDNTQNDFQSDQASSCSTRKKSARKKNRKKQQHSLDHLRQRVSELMGVFEARGYYIPQPDNCGNKEGKVWSSRIYGADKKRQRKNAEREMLKDRIEQLENHLEVEHGVIDTGDER